MKVISYVEGNVRGKTKEVDIYSLEEGIALNSAGLFLITTRRDKGYLFFKRINGKIGCYFQFGTKSFPQLDSLVEAIFEDNLKNN